jgi:hypothetical protein
LTISLNDHFGACPDCHGTDGIINVGKGHWFFCDEHKVRWYVGSNLFDFWREQTEEEQRAIYDSKDFGSFKDVEPYHSPTEPVRRSANAEAANRLRTHRDLYKEALGDVMYKSIGGSPWTDEVEDAIIAFEAKLDAAIDGVPIIAEILDKPVPCDVSEPDLPF